MHFAAQQSQTEAARALLQAGADVDPRDKHGNTPLGRAIFNSRGDVGTVAVLLNAGADPDVVNGSGVSPRALAERMAAADVLALIR